MRLDAPTRPKVVIDLGKDQSIVPLLNMTHRPGFVTEDDTQYGYVVFKEVGVLWRVQ